MLCYAAAAASTTTTSNSTEIRAWDGWHGEPDRKFHNYIVSKSDDRRFRTTKNLSTNGFLMLCSNKNSVRNQLDRRQEGNEGASYTSTYVGKKKRNCSKLKWNEPARNSPSSYTHIYILVYISGHVFIKQMVASTESATDIIMCCTFVLQYEEDGEDGYDKGM